MPTFQGSVSIGNITCWVEVYPTLIYLEMTVLNNRRVGIVMTRLLCYVMLECSTANISDELNNKLILINTSPVNTTTTDIQYSLWSRCPTRPKLKGLVLTISLKGWFEPGISISPNCMEWVLDDHITIIDGEKEGLNTRVGSDVKL